MNSQLFMSYCVEHSCGHEDIVTILHFPNDVTWTAEKRLKIAKNGICQSCNDMKKKRGIKGW